jgi:hypothetical protein
VRTLKKPSPAMAKSSGSPVSRLGLGEKSVSMLSTCTAVDWLPIAAPVALLESSSSPNSRWAVRSLL